MSKQSVLKDSKWISKWDSHYNKNPTPRVVVITYQDDGMDMVVLRGINQRQFEAWVLRLEFFLEHYAPYIPDPAVGQIWKETERSDYLNEYEIAFIHSSKANETELVLAHDSYGLMIMGLDEFRREYTYVRMKGED